MYVVKKVRNQNWYSIKSTLMKGIIIYVTNKYEAKRIAFEMNAENDLVDDGNFFSREDL